MTAPPAPNGPGFTALRADIEPLLRDFTLGEHDGRLLLQGRRMLVQSARSLGQLREELIHLLGTELARGVLKRYGYQAGFQDGHALCQCHPGLPVEQQMHLGTVLHQKKGHARIETEPEGTHVDLARGVLDIRSRWHDSVEAEQHLLLHGPSAEPVCWTLGGYAAGHLSYLLRREVVAVETTCRAQGHPYCRFRVGFREEMEKHFPGCADDYRRLDLGHLFHELEQTVEAQRRTIRELRERLDAAPPAANAQAFAALIGRSPALARAVDIARAVAGVSSTVLITGESGTGKELLARGIHAASPRAAGPWIALNCATLTESLQTTELFGHAKGAFTGASGARAGLFEAASGGTLFLDEVGELSASAQAALLRVLQEGVVVRLGEHRERRVDVRIVAATHRDLDEHVARGQFRADLYYRLNVVSIRMPALRERGNDVLLLAQTLLAHFGARFGRNLQGFAPEVLRLFLAHPWPGNVRELANVLERAVLLARGPHVELDDLPERFAADAASAAAAPPSAGAGAAQTERERIAVALARSGGRREAAAALLGISRATLWRRMKRLGLG
ncbi:regulatory Fis family protein [Plasticicumulans lactativorans]|uniref:Regulatory Fis family protein n=1 Tax=Plasticicumulans lactativorans TaxID=1133106 RepID=A0A4R2LQ46_9GAMM|nr:sigma 54-interacting transcriptional regulator [Plasticicumulans lactativorans]TCO81674.1 regulatory Fis family protein [Plasticicumulans lactativorans]